MIGDSDWNAWNDMIWDVCFDGKIYRSFHIHRWDANETTYYVPRYNMHFSDALAKCEVWAEYTSTSFWVRNMNEYELIILMHSKIGTENAKGGWMKSKMLILTQHVRCRSAIKGKCLTCLWDEYSKISQIKDENHNPSRLQFLLSCRGRAKKKWISCFPLDDLLPPILHIYYSSTYYIYLSLPQHTIFLSCTRPFGNLL